MSEKVRLHSREIEEAIKAWVIANKKIPARTSDGLQPAHLTVNLYVTFGSRHGTPGFDAECSERTGEISG